MGGESKMNRRLSERTQRNMLVAVTSYTDEIRLARLVEDALGEEMLTRLLDGGWAYLNTYSPKVDFTLHQSLRADRAFVHALRRALGVPWMKRTFSEGNGEFTWEGKSSVYLLDGKPLQVVISSGSNGCAIKRVEETTTRVRYIADCGDEPEGMDTDPEPKMGDETQPEEVVV